MNTHRLRSAFNKVYDYQRHKFARLLRDPAGAYRNDVIEPALNLVSDVSKKLTKSGVYLIPVDYVPNIHGDAALSGTVLALYDSSSNGMHNFYSYKPNAKGRPKMFKFALSTDDVRALRLKPSPYFSRENMWRGRIYNPKYLELLASVPNGNNWYDTPEGKKSQRAFEEAMHIASYQNMKRRASKKSRGTV